MLAKLNFPVISIATAPPEVVPLLERIKKKFSGIPPIKGMMANSPVTLESYLDLSDNMDKTSFSKIEQQAIYLLLSSYNQCGYCMNAHTHALKNIFKQPPDSVDAIVAGQPTGHAKTDALLDTVRALLEGRGEVSEGQRSRFVEAGYTEAQLIDLLAAIAMKTLTNYMGRLAQLD
ncbi:MAG: hypothetical protein ABJ327_21015 [Litoreibacter sp.]